jgi:hypothetical protein
LRGTVATFAVAVLELRAISRHLNAGRDERLHACLRKPIERADGFDEQTGHTAVLGLGISG